MSIPNLSLVGKVAIITGGRRGIGRAIALAFAEAGADMVLCDKVVETGELDAVAEEIKKFGRRSLAIRADVRYKADVDNLVRRAMDELGAIDILVNSAGIEILGIPLLECGEGDWDETLDTNIKGYYICAQAVGKGMVDQKRGNIVNIASVNAFRGDEGDGPYNVAKAGVVSFTKTLAKELASYNIRINAIAPGTVRTALCSVRDDPVALRQREATVPIGRIAEPSDIANVALFLASEASGYVTGHTIVVDGGWTA